MSGKNLNETLDEIITLQGTECFALVGFHLEPPEIESLGDLLESSGASRVAAGQYKGLPVYRTREIPPDLERDGAELSQYGGIYYFRVNLDVMF